MSDKVDLRAMGQRARGARRALATLETTAKNDILNAVADRLEDPAVQQAILKAN